VFEKVINVGGSSREVAENSHRNRDKHVEASKRDVNTGIPSQGKGTLNVQMNGTTSNVVLCYLPTATDVGVFFVVGLI
jgi:hypothetical protein